MHLLQTTGSPHMVWMGWRLMKSHAQAEGAVELAAPADSCSPCCKPA
jgi:threonine/homoserine/homoserine lactone efflux protein